MRERAKEIKCTEEVKAFETCCKGNGLMMVFNCRPENTDLKDCLTRWYRDEDFIKECTEIYLKDRTEYRSTGLTKKQRAFMALQNNNA